MIELQSIVESVRSEISREIADTLVTVKMSYEKNVLSNPLRKTYILLDLGEVTVLPYRDNNSYYTKQTKYKFLVNIHRSENTKPQKLIEYFSQVINIIDNCSFFDLEEAGCSKICSDADSNSIYLPGYIKLTIYS